MSTFGVLVEYYWSTIGVLVEYYWSPIGVLLEYYWTPLMEVSLEALRFSFPDSKYVVLIEFKLKLFKIDTNNK